MDPPRWRDRGVAYILSSGFKEKSNQRAGERPVDLLESCLKHLFFDDLAQRQNTQ